ncbi:MAG: bifunctional proline dehydrogenase/L-glutamate gamma-semialdehyde dehydrogenase PutA [Cellvibrionales bacterium]|nr:bifunctional proline dehydrogenase/L-glutamate gamma-semialdehyde dehydrogenase PutA [Cellvibrionales bacterium]
MLFDHDFETTCEFRKNIRHYYRIDENQAVSNLLKKASIPAPLQSKIWDQARQLVEYIRLDSKGQSGVDALLNEFSLSSEEGVVLMCLAEALLRVPDKQTQDDLIKDKLVRGNWASHLGNSDSLFVNASSWALLLTGKVVTYNRDERREQLNILKKAVGRLGEPVIRRSVNIAMRIMGKQFVTGKTIDEALERSHEEAFADYRFSFDMLGEGARTMADADAYYQSYLNAIHAIGKDGAGLGHEASPGISVKLSALHPRYAFAQYDRVMGELVPKVKALALVAKEYDIGFTIDAEEADRLDISLDIIEALFLDSDLDGWDGFGLAVQAYQKRAVFVIEWLIDLTQRANKKMMVRLVKGAYWDSEIKWSQQGGLDDFPVFTRKASTDLSYIACSQLLLNARHHIYPQFATHNALSVSTVLALAGENFDGFEFQRLHGMGESLYAKVLNDTKVPCRVYAPVGVHEDLLAYLVRRLLENGANSSFVNAILDESKSLENLLMNPMDAIKPLTDKANAYIPQPAALFADRRNSQGADLTDIEFLGPFQKQLLKHEHDLLSVAAKNTGMTAVNNPANHQEVIGFVPHFSKEALKDAINRSEAALSGWQMQTTLERANCLIKLADLLETHRDRLITLCIKEAGKVLQDGIDEVREAVDFCRYYAQMAQTPEYQNAPSRGVILCISPWNFPLAIFLGQVAAAAVMGNTVLAKPAEQTSLIAEATLELMLDAGFPKDVVQLLIASGREVGEVVVSDSRIAAVMFTGSTATGQTINRQLAKRLGHQVPLIAETGGQNCMIVDSTALLEQVTDDVIASGFQSAGQRCSALRVLFVQEDIADQAIELITGAMKELVIGDPKWLATDIGPVIDERAQSVLQDHVDYLDGLGDSAKCLYTCDVNIPHHSHTFFAPRLYEIDDIALLKQEVFGPVVHLIRFKADALDAVMASINGTGFGLTMGVHTRIDDRAMRLADASGAGNIYINRNMIGAVVGVQPFGGHGLSGTGPKAGGPNYLGRLLADVEAVEGIADSEALDKNAQAKMDVNSLFKKAQAVGTQWAHLPLADRVSQIRILAAQLADSEMAQSRHLDVNDCLERVNRYLNDIKLAYAGPVALPGPTGESNTLHFSARGCILNYASTETSFLDWMTSLLSAVALGNTVITIVSDVFYEEAKVLFDAFNQSATQDLIQLAKKDDLLAILEHPSLKAVVLSSECRLTNTIKAVLADREGPILPMINAASTRFVASMLMEKTISIDTTASGGNAALMAMDEDD